MIGNIKGEQRTWDVSECILRDSFGLISAWFLEGSLTHNLKVTLSQVSERITWWVLEVIFGMK